MPATSLCYFDSAVRGAQYHQDIPTFAIHAGSGLEKAWDSWNCQTPGDFKEIMIIVNPQVPVYLAMPRYYADKHFQPKMKYSSVNVAGWKPSGQSDQGYRVGNPVTMVLHEVMVKAVDSIYQWGTLPNPPRVQKTYLEKAIGRQAYIPVQVTMWVKWGEVV